MSHIIDLDKEESREDLTGRVIGHGSFGCVAKSFWRGRDVAVKQFMGTNALNSLKIELKNLKKVDHENIIKCLAFKKSKVLIVMEFAENGSLHQLLHSPNYENVPYNIAHAIDWALQCAKGVQYLHSLKPKLIIHRDLKPLNILLMNNFTKIKICDFGTACIKRSLMTSNQGSCNYMSPEIIQSQPYNEKCDVFSWSIILWELFSRRIPFLPDRTEQPETVEQDETNKSTNLTTVGHLPPSAISFSIAHGVRPKLLRNCPKVLEDLILSCWQESSEKRPSINEIVDELEQYFDLLKDYLRPIDSASIVPDDSQGSYLSFNQNGIQFHNSTIQNYTYTTKRIPDNVNLEPHCEMIKISNMTDESTPVLEHYINYTPSYESTENELEILNFRKIEKDEGNMKYVSTIETQVDSANDDLLSEESNGQTTGCGISSLFTPVTRILNPPVQSRTIFYTNYQEIDELDSKFATLTPKDNQAADAYTKVITRHKKKNHRSEIEINNCKIENSSASSTISSSSTSIVNNKETVAEDGKLDDETAFRPNEEVDGFFNLNNSSPNTKEDEELACSDGYKSNSSVSSFESVDKEKVDEQIANEYPAGYQINYKFDKKKRRLNIGINKTFKKVFGSSKDFRLPPEL